MGEPVGQMEILDESYRKAKIAQLIGSKLMAERALVLYRDVQVLELLQTTSIDFDELTFLQEKITSFDVCRTLEIFLEQGNIKRAAACAFIHDNAMRYRIQRLEEQLHLDLKDPLNRMNLLLKVKLWLLAKGRQ